VPDDSLETYKTATNWASLASRILPMSLLPKVFIFPYLDVVADKSVQMEAYLPNEKAEFKWSIVEGANYATISDDGILTFAESNSPYSVKVRASLKSDDNVFTDVVYARGVSFVNNKILNGGELVKDGHSYAYIPLKPGSRIEYCDTSGESLDQVESHATIGGTRLNYHYGGTGVKTLNFGYNVRYVAISLLTSSIEYLYVKDTVTGIYLYKGKNVAD
jgi:hypothetical protein